MSTISISLPRNQIEFIDTLVSQYGFANRSEFVRSVLRFIRHQPKVGIISAVFPFVSPKEKSVEKILTDFEKTKRYSKAFLRDLEQGLKASDYFTK